MKEAGAFYAPYIPLIQFPYPTLVAFDEEDSRVVYLKLVERKFPGINVQDPPPFYYSVFPIKSQCSMRFLAKYVVAGCLPELYWIKERYRKNQEYVTVEEYQVGPEPEKHFGRPGDHYAKLTFNRVEDVVLFKMFNL